MNDNNELFFKTSIEYDPSKESGIEVLKKYSDICHQSVCALLDQDVKLDDFLLTQFQTTNEAVQNSIDAISEKNSPWKIDVKMRVRPDRENIEIYIKDNWIWSNSKGSYNKGENPNLFIGKDWLWEKTLRQALDKYQRVSSPKWSSIFMRTTNKDYLQKMVSRLPPEELDDLLN